LNPDPSTAAGARIDGAPALPQGEASGAASLATTVFRRALAASGLVDGLLLHRIAEEVSALRPKSADEQDRLYAERLVAEGRLNPWQVDQLRQGRTKFTLGPYRVLDTLGAGGMGHVFKAEHELLGRVEAVKVLPRNKTTPEAIAGFRHEIRAQAQLDHPNLVRVSYADRDGDTYFFVTEFIDGIDLRRLVRRHGALAEPLAAAVVAQAALAIDYAHRRGLVHRDVKPGNLLITRGGLVKVTDLGLAWYLDGETSPSVPQGSGKVVGTSDYLAPEAIRHPDRVLPASDIYGLGCTLYYAVTGKVPFPGGNHVTKLKRQVSEQPVDPRRISPGTSDAMASLVAQMMAKDPAARPPSAAFVAEALARLCGSGAEQRLGVLVRDTLERSKRNEGDSTTDSSVTSEPTPRDDLPETVGIPLDNRDLLDAAAAAVVASPPTGLPRGLAPPPPSRTRRRGEPGRRGWRHQAPWIIAAASILATIVLLLLIAGRGW
jgi:serine/threonine protein kinase